MYEKKALELIQRIEEEEWRSWKVSRMPEKFGGKLVLLSGYTPIASDIYSEDHAQLLALHDPETVKMLCTLVFGIRFAHEGRGDAISELLKRLDQASGG